MASAGPAAQRSPAPLPHTSASAPPPQPMIFAHIGLGVLGDQAEPSQWSTASSAQICGGDSQFDRTACGSTWHEGVPTAHASLGPLPQTPDNVCVAPLGSAGSALDQTEPSQCRIVRASPTTQTSLASLPQTLDRA